jgi:hypothetical protein
MSYVSLNIPSNQEGAMPDKRAETESRTEKKQVVTTYGDLKDGETILDKSGNEWRFIEPTPHAEWPDMVTFWLGTDGVRQHNMMTPVDAEVTVLRVPSHVEEVAAREAEFDAAYRDEVRVPEGPMSPEEVAEMQLGGEVVARESAAEHDARTAAETTGDPVILPRFSDMTDLEQRSHLYLLHGVYCGDVKFREKLYDLHIEAHGPDRRGVPHKHVAGTAFPTEEGSR